MKRLIPLLLAMLCAGLLACEMSDLLYHLIVLMVERGVTLEQVREELTRRREKESAK